MKFSPAVKDRRLITFSVNCLLTNEHPKYNLLDGVWLCYKRPFHISFICIYLLLGSWLWKRSLSHKKYKYSSYSPGEGISPIYRQCLQVSLSHKEMDLDIFYDVTCDTFRIFNAYKYSPHTPSECISTIYRQCLQVSFIF